MAIQFFCGRPGSGKSYGVVENVIVPAIKSNRLIYTNIPLNLDAIIHDYPSCQDRIRQFSNEDVNGDYLLAIPGGAIIIIDECWRFWASGLKVTDMKLQDKEFFAEHRHKVGDDKLTQEIILVSQSPSQIAKYVRDLIDQTVLTTKADKVGFSSKYQVQIFSACIPSIDKPGEPNTTGMGTYKPEIYKYYKSHTKSQTGLPGIEIKADKRGSIWSHWYIRYVAPVVLLGSVWGGYFTYTFFTGKVYDKQVTSVQPSQGQQYQPSKAVNFSSGIQQTSSVYVPPVPVQSPTKRITAYIIIDGKQYVYLSHAEKRHLIKVGMEQCHYNLNGLECVVDNEIVTTYTGIQKEEQQGVPSLTQSIVPKV